MDISLDARMLVFAFGVTAVACLLFGLTPALRSTKSGRPPLPGTPMSRRWRFGSHLLAIQVAVSILLVIGAGLFGRTLRHLYTFDIGFDRRDVFVFQVNTLKVGYSGAKLREVQNRIVREVAALPGIAAAAIAEIPLLGDGGWDGVVYVEGRPPASGDDARAHLNSVGPGYFATLGTPILAGREFTDRDVPGAPTVAIVNQTFADFYFGGESPLGHWLSVRGAPRMEIVGVATNMKYQSLRQPYPRTVFFPLQQMWTNKHAQDYVVRVHPGVANPAHAIAATITRVDPALKAVEMRSMTDHIKRTLLRERLLTTLTTSLGLLGVVLVAVGVYGVVAFRAAQRTKEMGIRMALGALPHQLIRIMLTDMLVPVGIGILVGVTASLYLTRFAEGMLFGVTGTDAATLASSCGVLLLLAMVAAWLPSSRASRVSLTTTLRAD